MAIFRGGVKIFGSDVRFGISRDRSLDNVLLDKRFRQIEGGQTPDNPNLQSNKPALINQMLQYINEAEGLARSNRFYTSFQLPKGSLIAAMGSDDEFENFETAGDLNDQGRALESLGFATQEVTHQIQNKMGRRVNAFCKAITMPDRTMKTEEVINGPGAPYHIVTDHTYADTTATFYADKYLRERQYFELWQKAAFNDRTNNYELYENYVSDIDIFHLGQFSSSLGGCSINDEDPQARDDVTHGVKLYDCYPVSIGAPALAYDSSTVFEFTVTFKYRYWMNYFINKTADVELGDGHFDMSINDEQGRLKVGGGLFGSFLNLLGRIHPELRRAGRDVLGDLKRRIPIGDLTGGRVFPPFF